jgi:hypothetical protein
MRFFKAGYEELALKRKHISALSTQEAAFRAAALITDSSLFRCIESLPTDEHSIERLPEEVKKLLRRCETIELLKGRQLVLSRASIGESKYHAGYLRIGSVTDGEAEICVRPPDETVYELYADEPPALDPRFGTYTTIHHFLVAIVAA